VHVEQRAPLVGICDEVSASSSEQLDVVADKRQLVRHELHFDDGYVGARFNVE
jgi:hypothetical protein